jgi:O-methyltransferase
MNTETVSEQVLGPYHLLRMGSSLFHIIQTFRGEAAERSRKPRNTGFPWFESAWQRVAGYCFVDRRRAEAIVALVQRACALPGAFIECGTYKGGTSVLMGLALRHFGATKKIYMLDSFQGLPKPNQNTDSMYKEGDMRSDYANAAAAIEQNGLEGVCQIVPGWFSDTLPTLNSDEQYSLVHLDCDLYDPAKLCLDYLYPRVVPGGFIIIDDYCDNAGGMQRALHEHVESTDEIIFLNAPPQAVIIKGVTTSNCDHETFVAEGTAGPRFSTALARSHDIFLEALEEVTLVINTLSSEFSRYASTFRERSSAPANLHSAIFPAFFCRKEK